MKETKQQQLHVGLIGFGSIGSTLAEFVTKDPALAHVRLTILVRKGRNTPFATVDDTEALLTSAPDLIIECAGHSAAKDIVPNCLLAGRDTVVASIGALADDALHDRLVTCAAEGGARLILPAGAIGGIDLLSALRPSGITEVVYEGRKPPKAWKGSPAEKACDLEALTEATTFFEGSARHAALSYPKNANVAATLALAGLGFDGMRAKLIADPAAPGNTHTCLVTAGGADYQIVITGKAAPGNARTSIATVYSLLREITNRAGPVAI
ncbi:MAG: aspartate dehydrogenase [Pseudomonadota bacterium]